MRIKMSVPGTFFTMLHAASQEKTLRFKYRSVSDGEEDNKYMLV